MDPQRKHRTTRQRQVILDVVRRADGHPTADEVYDAVRKILPRISMGTVYRNLDILAASGQIVKLEPDRPQMRFDAHTEEHYHLTCMRCGRIEDLPVKPSDSSLENLKNALGSLTRHGIFGHRLEFIGLCSRCREAGSRLPRTMTEKSKLKRS